ncbi:MAG: amidase, partial [Nocardioidaceae bacterium]
MDPLLELDLATAAAAIDARELSPVELTEAYLTRIEQTEQELNAYYTVDADGARAAAGRAAREIAAGRHRGPLHGIPVGVKDLFDTAGLRTTYGSVRYRDHVPDRDAVAVGLLRSAGVVLLGKHATHEFAWGGRTDNPHFGPTHNPHDLDRIPGGSSGGGGASVVARSCLMALGSDTAGSVRIPAALCGCVGLKPTRGWVAMGGAFPLGPTLDRAGLLTRTPRDAALAMGAMTGSRVESGQGSGAPRVGFVVGDSLELLDDEVAQGLIAARARLEASGVELREVRLSRVSERVRAVLTVVMSEAEPIHREAFALDPDSYGPDLAELLARGPVSAAEVEAARVVVASAVSELHEAFSELDVVMSATVPIGAPRIGELHVTVHGHAHPVELLLT